MTTINSKKFILLVLISSIIGINNFASAHIPKHLEHDIPKAQQIFEKRCTECHSINKALSSRTYRDWLSGISQRHGKSYEWISEEEARQIFLHLLVHLEPEFKISIQAKRLELKENWKILFCLISGFITIALLITTLIFGHSKKLRKKWFKGHSYFAIATFISAIIHGSYCFYIFMLR